MKNILIKISLSISALLFSNILFANSPNIKLLNVSYDPTRELYKEYNLSFQKYWKKTSGEDVSINQSHGGSGKQARSVIDGLDADIVTLALAYDIDAIAKNGGLISKDWQSKLKYNASPYTSTMVLLVRKGNPKNIKDWSDLARKDIEVVSPNPKTSGGARWGYLAAWGYALKKYGNDQTKAKDFVTKIFSNVKVLDSGARGSLISFSERNIGDVLISWENEAHLAIKEGSNKFEVITPSISILAEPPVAVVDKVVDKHNTRKAATAYLNYLYSDEGQNIIAKNFYRPINAQVAAKYANYFKPLQLFTIKELFGDWEKVHKTHFANGAIFDQIMLNKGYGK